MRRRSLQPVEHDRSHHMPHLSSSRYKQTQPTSKSLVVELTEIYFNEEIRRKHINDIIDSYFEGREATVGLKTAKLPEPILPLNMRRRSLLMNRTALKEDVLANTAAQPFSGMARSEVVELNNTFFSDQSLPPIFEATEDPQAGASSGLHGMALSALIEENKMEERSAGTLSTSQSFLIKRRPRVTSENQLYRILHVYQTQTKQPTFVVKEYKPECTEVFVREQKAWAILNALELPRLWQQTGLLSCQSRPYRSLKAHLFEVGKESVKAETIYKINVKHHYDELFDNDNELLKRVLTSICKQLMQIKGKLINHKISLANLCMVNDEAIIIEWGHSAVMESAKVGNQTVNSHTTPILKGLTEWFVTPEYLPPEFLDYVAGTTNYDVWRLPSAVDIWSVGCMLLQLLTLVPLWAPHRCQITGRSALTRRGLFHSKTRQLSEIANKQRKFCSNLKLHLDRLGEVDKRASPKIVELMLRMLSVEQEKRPTPEEVVAHLN